MLGTSALVTHALATGETSALSVIQVGDRIVGGTFSRKRWHDVVEDQERRLKANSALILGEEARTARGGGRPDRPLIAPVMDELKLGLQKDKGARAASLLKLLEPYFDELEDILTETWSCSRTAPAAELAHI